MRNGSRVGAAPPRPAAAEFAKTITHLLATNQIPEYVRLRNDFRLVEAGRLITYCAVPAEALDYLLTECPMRSEPTSSWLGGIRRSESGEAVCAVEVREERTPQGTRTVAREEVRSYRREFRGGVELAVALQPEDFGLSEEGLSSQLRSAILQSRPSPEAVSWTVEG